MAAPRAISRARDSRPSRVRTRARTRSRAYRGVSCPPAAVRMRLREDMVLEARDGGDYKTANTLLDSIAKDAGGAFESAHKPRFGGIPNHGSLFELHRNPSGRIAE